MKRILPLSILLVLAAVPAVRAATVYPVPTDPAAAVNVQVTTPLAAVPGYGYLPLRIEIANRGPAEGTWQFRFVTGNRTAFPGELGTGLSLSVPAAQNRDTWFYLPVVEPGILVNKPGETTGPGNAVPSVPPAIAGVYPGPEGVRTVFRITKTESSPTLVERTFVITQEGPASLLPAIAETTLPARTTVRRGEPDATGRLTRTTTTTVVVGSASSLSPAATPLESLVEKARQQLLVAGLLGIRGTSASSSTSTSASTSPGMTRVSVNFRQTGPSANLPIPGAGQVPEGFTVTVGPGPTADSAMRTFTFSQDMPTSSLPVRGGPARGGRGSVPVSPSAAAVETEAREKLADSGLLRVPAGVVQTVESVPITFPSISGPLVVVIFVQTGSAAVLPRPPANRLPADVTVNVHPGPVAGQVVRTVSYHHSATLAQGASLLASSPAYAMVTPLNQARIDLARHGFLRTVAGVQQSGMLRSPSGILSSFSGVGPSSPVSPAVIALAPGSAIPPGSSLIVTETGPSNLLPVPPPNSLPPGVTVNVTPGALPGEVTRNFVLPIGGVPGVSGAIATATLPSRPATEMVMEVTGPGLKEPLRIPLAKSLTSGVTVTPPLAVSAALETDLRTKLAGLRGVPNLSAVDFSSTPDDWRMWSSFHGLILGVDEFGRLSPQHRSVLRGWVAQGGQMFLIPETSEFEPGPPERIGAGLVRTLPGPLGELLPGDLGDQLNLSAPALSLPPAGSLSRFADEPIFGGQLQPSGAGSGWLLGFAIVFAAVVGPLNLFFVARGRQRHRLFVTTPVFALGGILALAAVILVRDGVGGSGVRSTVVALLAEDHAAVVFQDQVARTGFLRSTRFELGDDTILTPVPLPDYQVPGQVSLLAREEGVVDGNWFRHRWQSAHHLRRIVPTRGRVDWAGLSPGGAPMLVSSLTTPLRDLIFTDDTGAAWVAAEVNPGRPVTLERAQPGVWTAWMQKHFAGSRYLESVLAAAAPSAPRVWMAAGEESELGPIATLPSIEWSHSTILFTGRALGAPVSLTSNSIP